MNDQNPLNSHVRHCAEISYTIVAEVFSHHVDYKIYEIVGYDSENRNPVWTRAGADNNMDVVETLDESEPYLHGFVKWDGCSNWHFDEQDRVMLHGCSREDLENIGKVMAACWDWTSDLCKTWNP